MMGVAEAIGWGLLGSVVQGGIIALSVWLALKTVPPECAALRHRIALGGLVILLLAFIATEGLMLSDWRSHAACWSGAELPEGPAEAVCTSHGVPASGDPTGTVSADPAPSHRGVGKAKAVMATVPGPGIPRARGLEVLARAGTRPAGLLGLMWLTALVLLAARSALARRRLRSLVQGSRPADDPAAVAQLECLIREMGIGAPVALRESTRTGPPCVIGVRRPLVILPQGILRVLDPVELRALLAHELEHVRRRDTTLIAIDRCAAFLLFFNPFTRWIVKRTREEREVACDQAAVRYGDAAPVRYAGMLMVLDGFVSAKGPPAATLTLSGGGELLLRVRRLLEPRRARRPSRFVLLPIAILAIPMAAALAGASLTVGALGSWAIMAEDIEHREH